MFLKFLYIKPASRKHPKNESVEVLRGLAILLIVVGHVIGVHASGGMKVADDSAWRYIYVLTQYLCLPVPLFTAISGWVYAFRAPQPGQLKSLLRKKALRLLLPMVCVGTLYFLVQYFMPETNQKGELSEIWRIYVFPYTVYWYLPSLFLMFAFMILLDSRAVCSTPRAWIKWMAFACALAMVEPLLSSNLRNYFSIWGALAQMPYFLVGVAISRFPQFVTPKLKKYTLIGFCLCIVLQQVMWFGFGVRESEYFLPLRLFVGATVTTFLLTHTWRNRFLFWLGGFAYGIYLLHAFGTSGGRILLKLGGIHSEIAIFVLSVLLGLFLPVLAELLLQRFPLLRALFLGDKYQPDKPSSV